MPQATQRLSVHRSAPLSGLPWGIVCALVGLVLLLRQADARPPNIILILADDLGWGDLRSYGHPHARTPSLDRMAREGTLFTAYYTASGVCSPARTALMTGQFPSRLGVHSVIGAPTSNQAYGVPDYLDPAVPTITRLLKDAGYVTGHFGKWHLGQVVQAPGPDAYGIDEHRTYASAPHAPQWGAAANLNVRSQFTARLIDEAIQFVTTHRDHPFYLQVWTQLVHAPLHPSPEQLARYAHLTPHPALPYLSPEQIYLASLTDLDTQVGRLLTTLTELGLVQDTLVVFTSDNGPADAAVPANGHSGGGSPGPFRGRKRSLYEGGIRVPFLVRWPGHVPAGRVSHTVLAAVDWLPTIASIVEVVSVPSEAGRDGENVADIWFGTDRPRQKPLLWEWRFTIPGHVLNRSPIAAIREGPWKLLLNPDGSRVELYDIPTDPGEVTNLATQQMGVVFNLALKLLTWQASLPPGPVHPQAGQNTYRWPGQTP